MAAMIATSHGHQMIQQNGIHQTPNADANQQTIHGVMHVVTTGLKIVTDVLIAPSHGHQMTQQNGTQAMLNVDAEMDHFCNNFKNKT